MPELPEVETIRRGIEPHVVGRRITQAIVRDPRLRWPVPPDLAQRLAGRRIEHAGRRAKYLVLRLDNGDRLLIHLGMSGRIWVLDPREPLVKHDHVDIALDSGQLLRFHDPRRFGAVLIWGADEPEHELLRALGPEPFDAAFDGEYLYARSRGRRGAVKNFVMDGHVVVGAGNIYAAEALFRARVRPGRAAGRVTRDACRICRTRGTHPRGAERGHRAGRHDAARFRGRQRRVGLFSAGSVRLRPRRPALPGLRSGDPAQGDRSALELFLPPLPALRRHNRRPFSWGPA